MQVKYFFFPFTSDFSKANFALVANLTGYHQGTIRRDTHRCRTPGIGQVTLS